jgi:hypothetical protein
MRVRVGHQTDRHHATFFRVSIVGFGLGDQRSKESGVDQPFHNGFVTGQPTWYNRKKQWSENSGRRTVSMAQSWTSENKSTVM